MPALLWVAKYWKAIGIVAIAAGLAGTYLVMRAEISGLKEKNRNLAADQATQARDLEAAKAGIDNVNAALKQYRKWVADSFAAVERTQEAITDENRHLQAMLDNIVGPATAAASIVKAPRIPFFTRARETPLVFTGIDNNGAYHYRVLPPGSEADRGPVLPAGDSRGAPGP